MSAEQEPRRSVRATKGQHKALEKLDSQMEAPKPRRGKKGRKAAPEPEEHEEEEVIRCVCGATEQDEDSGEPWIACDACGAWQHNICMGMSQYSEDLTSDYYCEQCRPENHKELLEGMARGEKPWEARRRAYEEEEAEKKKRKGGPRKGKGKRASDAKDGGPKTTSTSPAPEGKREGKEGKEGKTGGGGKRKSREDSQEKETTPSQKLRKVSDTQLVPVVPAYDPPADLAAKIADLPDTRQGPAKALLKSLTHSIGAAEKKKTFVPSDGVATAARAEAFALQIERAVHDTHPNHGAYASQLRTLAFNLKNNPELAAGLLHRTLTPPMLAVMSTEELASKELQRETAEMKARAEKQSILITEDGPRLRRTHKGEEEVVGDDGFAVPSEETPAPPSSLAGRRAAAAASARRASQNEEGDGGGGGGGERDETTTTNTKSASAQPEATAARHPRDNLHISTATPAGAQHQSPKTTTSDFDINKVFSSVKSPTGGSSTGVQRRSSVLPAAAAAAAAGPGVDPEVDRMLQDDDDETNSPPYSPTEETDPDVVWRGELAMNGVASFPATAKHVGGAKLVDTVGLPWTTLIPRRLTVAGRIEVQRAVEYICGLRYSQATDIVVVSLQPAGEAARPHFLRIYDYFLSKNRYGVTGEKGVANVRDTYLVPVPPGGPGNQPEFMLNLADNFLPETRAEPMLLAVFVYRNTTPDSAQQQQQQHQGLGIAGQGSSSSSQSPLVAQSSPTPAYGNHHHPAQRTPSVSAPAFSPTSPQGSFSQHPSPRPPSQTTTPIQPPPPQPPQAPHDPRLAGQDAAQRQGEQVAREILGPLFHSPTVTFLLPHAYQMSRREWELIKRVYEREPRTRDDLVVLNAIIEKEEALAAGATAPPPPPNQAAGPQQQPQQQAPLPPAAAAAHHPPPGTSATPVPLPPHAQHSQTPIPPPTNQYAPPASQTPVPPPNPGHVAPPPRPVQPQRTTPIPPPPIPPQAGGPPRQTPIPPPPIPPHATAAAPPA